MQIELFSNPMPPAQNNNEWRFIARVKFDKGEPQQHVWVLPDDELQRICVNVLGRSLHHEDGIKAEEADLDQNWPQLRPALTERAAEWYRVHIHEFEREA